MWTKVFFLLVWTAVPLLESSSLLTCVMWRGFFPSDFGRRWKKCLNRGAGFVEMAALEAAVHAKMAVAFDFDCTDRGENKGILYLWHLGFTCVQVVYLRWGDINWYESDRFIYFILNWGSYQLPYNAITKWKQVSCCEHRFHTDEIEIEQMQDYFFWKKVKFIWSLCILCM